MSNLSNECMSATYLRATCATLCATLHRALHAKPRYSLTSHSFHVTHYELRTTHYTLRTTRYTLHTTHYASHITRTAYGVHSARGLRNQEQRLALFVFLLSLASDCLAARLYSSKPMLSYAALFHIPRAAKALGRCH